LFGEHISDFFVMQIKICFKKRYWMYIDMTLLFNLLYTWSVLWFVINIFQTVNIGCDKIFLFLSKIIQILVLHLTTVVRGVRVTRFLAFCVCLVNRCLENIFLIYLSRITDSFLYIRKAACSPEGLVISSHIHINMSHSTESL
jgi:hypothetical protein